MKAILSPVLLPAYRVSSGSCPADREKSLNDLLFEKDLKRMLTIHICQFREGITKRICELFTSWAEEKAWRGIISEEGIDYTKISTASKVALESIWRDYELCFPLALKRLISQEYRLDEETFSQWLAAISYDEALVKEERELLDHVFQDEIGCPGRLRGKMKLWNDRKHMIGNDILALDYMNGGDRTGDSKELELITKDLLLKYDIEPERIGFYFLC